MNEDGEPSGVSRRLSADNRRLTPLGSPERLNRRSRDSRPLKSRITHHAQTGVRIRPSVPCDVLRRRSGSRPSPRRQGRERHDAARRLSRHRLRRRAGRGAADLVLHRRPRPALRGRGAQLRHLAGRPARTASSSSRTPRATAGPTRARSSTKASTTSPASKSASAASGSCRRRTCTSSRTAMATTSPAGKPQVVFDGFGYKESRHNLANGFTWGPDGWLYAGHGRTSPSDVGRPGTPADQRIHCDGGVCRIHPNASRLRELRRRHHQSLGRRFRRFRPVLRLQLRQSAPVPHDPGRPLRAVARPPLQPVRLRTPADLRRPSALPQPASPTKCAAKLPRLWPWAAAMPTAAR